MRRGDAQVRATLAACKLPIQSAKWEVIAAEPGFGVRDSGFETKNPSFPNPESRNPNPVSSTGAGRATEAKAKEIAAFVRDNLFGGLEFRTSTGAWATQNWDDVVRNALLMLDCGCAAHEDVWAVDGSRVRLRKLAARLPLTFYRWHTELDGETLLALEQYGYRSGTLFSAYTIEQLTRTLDLAEQGKVNVAGAVTWAFEFENQPIFGGFRALSTEVVLISSGIRCIKKIFLKTLHF